MKNFAYIALGCFMWVMQGVVLMLISANIVLPILLTLYSSNGWWILLYIAEPFLMASYVWLDEKFEDM
jgi:hypothetical protein